jgi:hypothetical protein
VVKYSIRKLTRTITLLIAVLFTSCYYGLLGGADQTEAYYPGEPVFEDRMGNVLSGEWYSHYAGIGRLDGYRIRRWSDFSIDPADKAKAQALFPALNITSPVPWNTPGLPPDNNDYVLLYDSSVYGQQEDGTGGGNPSDDPGGFMGVVRAINIFNGNENRGSIIIEYFEGAEPAWLNTDQGLDPGEKPFFGIFYKVLDQDTVQMANAIDLAALYAGQLYYTEQETLADAIAVFDMENEAEYISWGVVIPQDRQ